MTAEIRIETSTEEERQRPFNVKRSHYLKFIARHDRSYLRNKSFFQKFELLDDEIQENLISVQQAVVDAQMDQFTKQVEHVLLNVNVASNCVQLNN